MEADVTETVDVEAVEAVDVEEGLVAVEVEAVEDEDDASAALQEQMAALQHDLEQAEDGHRDTRGGDRGTKVVGRVVG